MKFGSASLFTLVLSFLFSIPAKAVDDETAAARFGKLTLNQKFTSLNNQKKTAASDKDAVEKWIKKYNTVCSRFQRNINSYNDHLSRGSTVVDGVVKSKCESIQDRIDSLKDTILGEITPKGRAGGLRDQKKAARIAKNKALKTRNKYSPAVVARKLKAIDRLNLDSRQVVEAQISSLTLLIDGDGDKVEGLLNEALALAEKAADLVEEKDSLELDATCYNDDGGLVNRCSDRIDAIDRELKDMGADLDGLPVAGSVYEAKILDLFEVEETLAMLKAFARMCGLVTQFDEFGLPVFDLECEDMNAVPPTAKEFKAQYKAAIKQDAATRLAVAQADLSAKNTGLALISSSLKKAKEDLRKARAERKRLVRNGKCRESYEFDGTACSSEVEQLPYGSTNIQFSSPN